MTAYKIADLSMYTIFFNYYYSVNEKWTAFSQRTNNVSIFDCGYINLIKSFLYNTLYAYFSNFDIQLLSLNFLIIYE